MKTVEEWVDTYYKLLAACHKCSAPVFPIRGFVEQIQEDARSDEKPEAVTAQPNGELSHAGDNPK